ncbi:hypothetical protein CcCBS67573_g07374 [Chytriomyces confervae]|uniref:Cache domain-containing protein n=1 Tax=Chytriomyces confervae TaxID=246404 RepID=A0A507EVA7_9FUNG|nr:hypothetical protein CcCBS67573_g07374 [Chytriomyces confervae]
MTALQEATSSMRNHCHSNTFTMPVLLLVLVQTFLVGSIALIIPMAISFTNMNASNALSISTGRRVAQSLAVKIQSAEASLVLETIGSLIASINENTLQMYKAISAYGNQSNLDSLLDTFANEFKYTDYKLLMFYGARDDAFIQLQQHGSDSIWLTTPLGYNNPGCKICQLYRQNYTEEDWKWAVRQNGTPARGDWDQDSWTYSNFRFDNVSYHCTKRPWYKQAASLAPNDVRPQYTAPYLFAGGTASMIAGITVNIPFFDSTGSLLGVYGSDVSFSEMHNTLTKFLQTANSFMYIMTRDGQLIGSSTSASLVAPTGNLLRANESTDPLIQKTARVLWSIQTFDAKDFVQLDGGRWEVEDIAFQLRALKDEPHYVIVNGAPKSDYAADINRVQVALEVLQSETLHNTIKSAAACFFSVILVSVILLHLALSRPLARITTVMVAVTSLDFSKSSKLLPKFGTLVRELQVMERAFFEMISTFAETVEQTQRIVQVGTQNAFIYQEAGARVEKRHQSKTQQLKTASISTLMVVFIQSLVLFGALMSSTLALFLPAMQLSNEMSTSASRTVVNQLAVKIQNIQASLVIHTIETLIGSVKETVYDMRKTLTIHANQSNLDSILTAFATEATFTGYELPLFYGTKSDALIYLQRGVTISTPVGFQDSACKICNIYQQNFTTNDWEWIRRRNSSIAFGYWNRELSTYSDFDYGNITFHATQRPWYKQAAALSPETSQIQYTEPYIYAGGARGDFQAIVTGITANYPFFDDTGKPLGVFGTDISFDDLRDTLTRYLQTPNSFMYVTTPSGVLLGTSANDTMIGSRGNLIPANQSLIPATRLTAKFLWAQLPNTTLDLTFLSGQNWEYAGYSFQLRAMNYPPYFVIVNGAPKTDYTGDIDLILENLDNSLRENVRVIIGVSVAVFIVMVAVRCTLTYFSVVRPLAKITSIIRDATNFNFTAYKTSQLNDRSRITEFATMETVFYLMIAKFADSIRGSEHSKVTTRRTQTPESVHETSTRQKKSAVM